MSAFFTATEEIVSQALASGIRADTLPGIPWNTLRDALNYLSSFDKVLYGSDYRLAPLAAYRWFVDALIPAEHKAKVFRENAAKLFGL